MKNWKFLENAMNSKQCAVLNEAYHQDVSYYKKFWTALTQTLRIPAISWVKPLKIQKMPCYKKDKQFLLKSNPQTQPVSYDS